MWRPPRIGMVGGIDNCRSALVLANGLLQISLTRYLPPQCRSVWSKTSNKTFIRSMREHPGPARWKVPGAPAARGVSGPLFITQRLWRTAAAAATMIPFQSGQHPRRRNASLVGGMGEPALCGHRRKIRRSQKCPRCLASTPWTFIGQIALGHRPHIGKGSTLVADIVINRHWLSSSALSSHRRIEAAAGFTYPVTWEYRRCP
jgi:hypothetical protein